MMMEDDDEFSSDSDASSVDISLLVGNSLKPSVVEVASAYDFTPSDQEQSAAPAEKAAAEHSPAATEMNASRQDEKGTRSKRADATISDGEEKHEDEAPSAVENPSTAGAVPASRETQEPRDTNETIVPKGDKRIKIVMGESVFKWQRARRNQSTTSALSLTEDISKWVTIRDTPATASGSLHGAKITVTPPTVQATSQDKKEYTGKYASQSLSSSLVECVAIYNEERKCHVLEVVDWTVSNLKPCNTEPSTAIAPATHPREQSRQAEERVRKKQKHKTDASRQETPNEKETFQTNILLKQRQ